MHIIDAQHQSPKPHYDGVSPRVLFVIPGNGEGSSMIFTRRQIDSLRAAGVVARDFFLTTRTSPGLVLRERRRFQEAVREFAPNIVHAQYGTVTACFCLLSTRLPVVVTFHGSDLNPCRNISRAQSLAGRLLSQIANLKAREVICVSDPPTIVDAGALNELVLPGRLGVEGVDHNLIAGAARQLIVHHNVPGRTH